MKQNFLVILFEVSNAGIPGDRWSALRWANELQDRGEGHRQVRQIKFLSHFRWLIFV